MALNINRKVLLNISKKLTLKLSEYVKPEDVDRQLITALAILKRLEGIGNSRTPGVILGDEVGMGKTYSALAVAAAYYVASKGRARILIMAHSREMADEWRDRWNKLAEKNPKLNLPNSKRAVSDLEDIHTGIYFAAYDTLKYVKSEELKAALYEMLHYKGEGPPKGENRKRLIRELFPRASCNGKGMDCKVPLKDKKTFWRDYYNSDTNSWENIGRVKSSLKNCIYRHQRSPRKIDLLIIDEAHKLEGHTRGNFFEKAFKGRAHRALFVTATPFAMDLRTFLDRMKDLYTLCGEKLDDEKIWNALKRYKDYVAERQPMPVEEKKDLQQMLHKVFVRSRIDKEIRKSDHVTMPRLISEHINQDLQRYAVLSLEDEFAKLYQMGDRTQIATMRETLCSSFSAVIGSETYQKPAYSRLRDLLNRLYVSGREHPKLEACADWIKDNIKPPDKVVIFCKRIDTINELQKRLQRHFREEAKNVKQKWSSYLKTKKVQQTLQSYSQAKQSSREEGYAYLRMAFYHDYISGRKRPPQKRISWAQTQGLEHEINRQKKFWLDSWGKNRRINWVEKISGKKAKDIVLSNDVIKFTFNLPGPPYVLICSSIAREGIDLHRFCRKLIHYDLEWNPAAMEQRIGRVHRVGSLAERKNKRIEIYYLVTPDSYEEHIYHVVMERMDLLRAILGAGEWINTRPDNTIFDSERNGNIPNLKHYEMDFGPEDYQNNP